MKKFKRTAAKTAALVLTLALMLTLVPATLVHSVAASGEVTVGVMNDLHYFPQSLMGSDVQAFIEASKLNSTTSYLADALVDNALNEYKIEAQERGLKYLIIPGDLTKNGEYEGHRALAAKLEQFERDTGVEVFVINGNHDIRNGNAAEFKNGKFVSTRWTEPEEFREIYQNLGYDHAINTFTPPDGETAGMLSYTADLDGGYRLIALDGGCYSADSNSKGENKAETRGAYSEALLQWAIEQIADAKAKGLTVIGLTHFNLVEHFDCEDNLFEAFPIDNWQEVCESFADAGMHFAFTGHIHLTDIASHTSDNGETLTDCSSASMLNFPCYLRVVTLDNRSPAGDITATYQSIDIDRSRPVSAFGTTYAQPYRITAFALNFGGSDINTFVHNYLRYLLEYTLLPDIQEAGSLYRYLSKSLDLDSVLDGLLKSGSGLGAIKGVTKVSLKALIKNICDQVERTYLDGGDGTAHLIEVADAAVQKVTSLQMSPVPCTKYLNTYGFGDPSRGGNFGETASTVLATFYGGDEDNSDDPFMTDVLARFQRGENAGKILDTLIDVVLHDLLEDEILQNIHIDVFGIIGNLSGAEAEVILQQTLAQLLEDGDSSILDSVPQPSLAQIINLFFAAGIVEYKSLDDVLQHYMDEYLTESQIETIAYEFYTILSDLTTDNNPAPKADNNTTVTYSGKVKVVPTVEDLRLPSGISVTFGADAATSRNICWYTKTSVTGTDIEIVPYSAHPHFTGSPTTGSHIASDTKRVTREVPGVDLGVIGVLSHEFDVNRHMIKVGGLKAGQKYCYRVGDASRGWWSDVGVFDLADNSENFTFFHMSDSQGGIERQYETWANVVDTAFSLYPDAEFIMHTGDVVDSGKNFKQWNWAFNTASDSLMDTVMMPTTGNHETNGAHATVNNFLLSNVPDQDTENGVYYSFDYNNAHFMVLNTNDLNSDNTLSTKQTEWLKADAAASDKQWKIVSLHKAIYSNGSHYDDDDVVALRAQLSALMPELDIDVVLQGHDHVYLRTTAMKNNEKCEVVERTVSHNGTAYTAMVNPDGTVYTIDGCSGVKYYQTKDVSLTDSLFPRAQTIYDATAPVFSAIQIDGENLYFDAYTVKNGNASKIDSFAISKAADTAVGDTESGNTAPDSNVPKTAGKQVASALVFALPVAMTVAWSAGALKRKREEEI